MSLYLLLLQERYGVATDLGLLWYLNQSVSCVIGNICQVMAEVPAVDLGKCK